MGFVKKAAKTAALGAAMAVSAAVLTAAPAHAASNCHFSVSTNRYGCGSSNGIRNQNDVIGAKLFTGYDYSGNSLTIWVPRPCPKNDQVDHWIGLGSDMRHKVASVQAWSSCWVYLYFDDGTRDGPFKGNTPDVGTWAAGRTSTVGLS